MKHLMKALSLFTFSIIILLSCKKETSSSENGLGGVYCPNYGENYPIEDTNLINMKYLVGTYWNFIDSVSMTNDSVYIESAEFEGVSTGCGGEVEKHFITTRSASTQEEMTFSVFPGGFSTGGTYGQSWGETIFPDSEHNPVFYDSIFIYDQFYHNVYNTELVDYPSAGETMHYFINEDFGILRIEKYSNGVLTSNQNITSKVIVR
ncbi:MAG: hypothetical protein NXI10_09030 [bacterium]|nr:hypothetical protein [bacterium]